MTSGAYDTSFNISGWDNVFVSKLDGGLTTLLASTYLGGGESSDGVKGSIAIDQHGNVYVTGETISTDFPVTSGAYDTSFNGQDDVFVSKLDGELTSLLSSTLLGGTKQDYGSFLTIDPNGNVYVTGHSGSKDFPTTSGAYNTTHYYSAFVSKLDGELTTLLASTFLGGLSSEFGHTITLDPSGNVYVTGYTVSKDFPTTIGAYDNSFNREADVFISRLNSELSTLLASTYLGGHGTDWCRSLVLDISGNVYITGETSSINFPTTSDAYGTFINVGR